MSFSAASSSTSSDLWLTTVLSIFANNFVLLLVIIVLLLLVILVLLLLVIIILLQIIRRLSIGTAEEFKRRFSEIDWLLKTTQKRVEAVEKKIEEKGAILGRKLKKLEAASKELERHLGTLMAEEWVSRECAIKMIMEEVEKHAADGIGRLDYALRCAGAAVVKHSETIRGSAKNGVHPDAHKMLKPSFGEVGRCFPLKGSSGFVEIRLWTAVVAEAVTLEHVAKSVAYDRSTAPKDCRVYGWLHGRDDDCIGKMILLAEFTYDLDKSNVQTYNVLKPAVVDTVRLDFTSNHGSHLTCIYRFRVHGQKPCQS